MSQRKTPNNKANSSKNNQSVMALEESKLKKQVAAEMTLSPLVGNTATASRFAKGLFGELDLMDGVDFTRESIALVKAGDLSGVEATLVAQAMTLDKIFNEMAQRAASNMGEYMGAMETYMKLALKAQSQCRTTLQTLAEIKNPQPVAFVKQANIAHGPQQINNGVSPRAENSKNATNELLEANNGERLDTRTTGATSATHQELATLATSDGAENGKG